MYCHVVHHEFILEDEDHMQIHFFTACEKLSDSKHPRFLISVHCLHHHDNAPAYICLLVQKCRTSTVLSQGPHSPNLTPAPKNESLFEGTRIPLSRRGEKVATTTFLISPHSTATCELLSKKLVSC
jgi:hypothetical protein